MKLWGGRFNKGNDSAMDAFDSSIAVDQRLYRQDIVGSIAHVRMLAKQDIIPASDASVIEKHLRDILSELDSGKLTIDDSAEDIHSAVEAELTRRAGNSGKRLHTGRSRNDQVALDMRMYMKDAIHATMESLCALEISLLNTASENTDVVMPGYTHMQKAQPVTLAHHLLAYVDMFSRDLERLAGCYQRTDVMPLGSGALATSTYPLDRNYVARELGFSRISLNSMDAVSDRDFCIEYAAASSMIMMHLSRFCEELVLWSSDEFRFVEMDDAYSTGSSIMPQKKNPDAAELIRGKTGRVYGDLTALLTIMKGLPLAYDKDMQEDKEATFDAVDTVLACLSIFRRMFDTLHFNVDELRYAAASGFTNATDAADYLVKKGMPFRNAHEVIGKLVVYCIEENKTLDECDISELREFSTDFSDDVYDVISLDVCVEERDLPGGPAPQATRAHIANMRGWMNNYTQQNLQHDTPVPTFEDENDSVSNSASHAAKRISSTLEAERQELSNPSNALIPINDED